MHLLSQLAVIAAALYSLPFQVNARTIPNGSLRGRDHVCTAGNCLESVAHLPRDLQAKPEDFDALEKRNFLIERAPVFEAPRIGKPKPEKPKPKGSGSDESSSSGSEPSDQGAAPVRLGTGSPSESSGDGVGKDPVRIAADDSASAPKPEPKPEDKPADDIPESNVGASKPGDTGVTTFGDSKDFQVLQDKGARVDKEVHDAFNNRDDAKLPNKLEDNYELESEAKEKLLPNFRREIEPSFNDLGVSAKEAKYVDNSLYNKEIFHALPTAFGKYFGKDGIIIGEGRFTKDDMNPPEKQMKPSDMVFLQWEKAATEAGGDVKGLKGFVGYNVVSKSTLETMQKGQRETKQPLDQKAVFKRGDTGKTPEETTAKNTAWERMLGTDFISSLNYMLKDHAVALGRKEISEIRCYPRTWDPKTKSGDEKVMITVKFDNVN